MTLHIVPNPLTTLTVSADSGPGFVSIRPGETVNVCTETAGLVACVYAEPGIPIIFGNPADAAKIADILDAAGIAPGPDVVGRVRPLSLDLQGVREVCDKAGIVGETNADRVREMARRLDASERDRHNLKTYLDDANKTLSAITAHILPLGVADVGDRLDVVIGRVVETLHRVQRERDEAIESRKRYGSKFDECHRLLDRAGLDAGGIAQRVTALVAERDALRAPKPGPVVEWRGFSLIINDKTAASVGESLARPGIWLVARPGLPLAEATSEDPARRLAELLANHDPGGIWRIAGHVVPVDVVRAVCASVAVTWGES